MPVLTADQTVTAHIEVELADLALEASGLRDPLSPAASLLHERINVLLEQWAGLR